MDNLNFLSYEVRNCIENKLNMIEGWLHIVSSFIIPILNNAQKNKQIYGDIIEIGTWQGKSLILFQHLLEHSELIHGYDLNIQDKLKENIHTFCIKNGENILLSKVNSLMLNLEDIKREHKNIRFFHVDGSHTYKQALNDIYLATQSTNKNGIVIIDDFFSPTVPGVTQALFYLLEYNNTNNFFPFAIGGAKVYLCEKLYIDYYRDYLFNNMPISCKNGADVDILFGNKIAIYDLY